LDPDQNGFIEFKDFSSKFQPNLPHLLGNRVEYEDHNRAWGGAPAPNA